MSISPTSSNFSPGFLPHLLKENVHLAAVVEFDADFGWQSGRWFHDLRILRAIFEAPSGSLHCMCVPQSCSECTTEKSSHSLNTPSRGATAAVPRVPSAGTESEHPSAEILWVAPPEVLLARQHVFQPDLDADSGCAVCTLHGSW